MFKNHNVATIILLLAFSVLMIAAQIKTGNKFKNLKVLPKDISEYKLDSIMSSYNKALNVSCDFCHIKAKNSQPPYDTVDYALDNKMKEEARRMIRMMNNINRTHFYYDSSTRPEYLNVVSCNTCHRGNPFPAHE